ncbi:hypothetical protein V6N13_061272 [Hibiscus sabdariffa]
MVSTIMEGEIDGLEKKMEDIQGEIIQVKDLLDSLAVAKVVAENTDDQGYVGCSEAVQCQEETHPKRLELPIFSGDNPCEWLHRAEQYFHFTGIGDKDNLESSMSLDGTVSDLQWSLVEFESLFEDPAGFPPSRSPNHTLLLKERSQQPNYSSILLSSLQEK